MARRGGERNVHRRPLPNIVPSIFVGSIQGIKQQDMALRNCNNHLWHVKIEKFGNDWYFTDGWVKFVKDNLIERGDQLFYQAYSRGVLDFKVLGPSGFEDDGIERLEIRTTKRQDMKTKVKTEGVDAADDIDKKPPKRRDTKKVVDGEFSDCEDDGIEHLEMRTTKGQDERMEVKTEDVEAADDVAKKPPKNGVKEKVADAGPGASVHGKRKKKQDFYCVKIFKSGQVRPPANPYFVTDVREKRVNEMYIPADVVKSYKIELPETMMLVDSEGREFETRRKSWKDGRVNYSGGWKALCRANLAGIGDKLICEFIGGSGEDGDLHLNVSLFRAK